METIGLSILALIAIIGIIYDWSKGKLEHFIEEILILYICIVVVIVGIKSFLGDKFSERKRRKSKK